LKREIEEVVDAVILNIIYFAGVVLMIGCVIVFGVGHFKQNADYMSHASNWGIVAAVVTLVVVFARRMRKSTGTHQNPKDLQGG